MVLLFLLFYTSWLHMDHWLQRSTSSSTSSTLLIVMDTVIQWFSEQQWEKRETYSSSGPKVGGKKRSKSYIYREMLPRDMYMNLLHWQERTKLTIPLMHHSGSALIKQEYRWLCARCWLQCGSIQRRIKHLKFKAVHGRGSVAWMASFGADSH